MNAAAAKIVLRFHPYMKYWRVMRKERLIAEDSRFRVDTTSSNEMDRVAKPYSFS